MTAAAGLTEFLHSRQGPVVLASHSQGSAAITNVPTDAGHSIGLVYVAASLCKVAAHWSTFGDQ